MSEVINDRVLERNYAVGSGAGPVLLSVIIGDGQIGGSAVFIDANQKAKGQITHQDVGAPAALQGHHMTVRTVVFDINEQTNKTSVTYLLTGGAGDAEYTLWFEAPQDKMGVPYTALFTFV
ncbi:MAG: hypothetical protein AABO58_04955 [Acidobacteriota bacterium]